MAPSSLTLSTPTNPMKVATWPGERTIKHLVPAEVLASLQNEEITLVERPLPAEDHAPSERCIVRASHPNLADGTADTVADGIPIVVDDESVTRPFKPVLPAFRAPLAVRGVQSLTATVSVRRAPETSPRMQAAVAAFIGFAAATLIVLVGFSPRLAGARQYVRSLSHLTHHGK